MAQTPFVGPLWVKRERGRISWLAQIAGFLRAFERRCSHRSISGARIEQRTKAKGLRSRGVETFKSFNRNAMPYESHMTIIWYLYIYLYDYHMIPEDVLCDMDLMFQDVSWPGAKKMTHSIWWHLNLMAPCDTSDTMVSTFHDCHPVCYVCLMFEAHEAWYEIRRTAQPHTHIELAERLHSTHKMRIFGTK
jgi:hypothetical protein